MKEFDLRDLEAIPDPLSGRSRGAVAAAARPAERGPTRSALRRRRAIVVGVGLAWLVAIQFVIGIRSDVPTLVMALHVGVPSVLAAAALWLALEPGNIGLGPTVKALGTFSAVSLAAFAFGALAGPWFLGDAGIVRGEEGGFFEGIFFCGDFILGAAVIPLAALAWAHRKSDAVGTGVKSMLLGVSVGFAAAGLQALHCAHSDGMHVLLGHGWPVLVMGLVGWFALRRTTRVA